MQARAFAQEYIDIAGKDREIIYHAHNSLLFDEKDTWKKMSSGLFDITVGAYDGVEVCQLLCTHISKITDFIMMMGWEW